MKTCAWCGAPFTIAKHRKETPRQFDRREFCSRSCGSAKGTAVRLQNAERERLAKIEDAEWIIGTDSPEHIASRLGYPNLEALQRSFYRWGRADLLARMGLAA